MESFEVPSLEARSRVWDSGCCGMEEAIPGQITEMQGPRFCDWKARKKEVLLSRREYGVSPLFVDE